MDGTTPKYSKAGYDKSFKEVSFDLKVVNYNPKKIGNGYAPVLDCHNFDIAVKVSEIHTKIDRRSGKEIGKEPKLLKNRDAGSVKMIPIKPMVVETFPASRPLDRSALREMRQTVAVGVIKSVEKKEVVIKSVEKKEATGAKVTKKIAIKSVEKKQTTGAKVTKKVAIKSVEKKQTTGAKVTKKVVIKSVEKKEVTGAKVTKSAAKKIGK